MTPPAATTGPQPTRTPPSPARRLLRSILSLRGLAAITALLSASLWLLTLWAWPSLSTRWFYIDFAHGEAIIVETDRDLLEHDELVVFTLNPLSDLPGYDFRYRLGHFKWRPRAGSTPTLNGLGTRWDLQLPLWIPFAICTPIAVMAWRTHIRRRRQAAVRCPECNYDLAGLPLGSPCPECGAAFTG